MTSIQQLYTGKERPVRVLQYGEGNFLRAFADWMIDIANERGVFDGSIAIVKPIQMGSLERFQKQNNVYTVSLRGNVEGKASVQNRVVTSVADAVDSYEDYARYADYAKSEDLRFVISNTTEAGIAYDPTDRLCFEPPHSFPGKLTKLLFERAEHFNYARDKGLVMLPVELIDNNGQELKKCVLRLAAEWELPERFTQWLETACVFTSTLVDRIVTGYPRDNAQELWAELGYRDELLVTAEPFGLWVIEGSHWLSEEFPLEKAGLPVVFTDNHKPFKQRKVRILNGAHTSFVPAAFLSGHNIVREAMEDKLFLSFMRSTLYSEVIPTLELPKEDLENFAAAVENRFNNPFVDHQLLSIALNSVSKWRARCQPSFLGYVKKTGQLPAHLAFSLAALVAFYVRGERLEDGALVARRDGVDYRIIDDIKVLEFFLEHRKDSTEALTKAVLSNTDFWGCDLSEASGLTDYVEAALRDVKELGMRAALEKHFASEAD